MAERQRDRRASVSVWSILVGLVLGAGVAAAQDLAPAFSRALLAMEANDCSEALRELSAVPDPPPETVGPRALLLTGYCLLKTGQPAEALPVLERAAAAYDLLADYALSYAAQSARAMQDGPKAIAVLSELLTRFPKSRLAPQAHLHLSATYVDLERYPDAEKSVRTYLDRYPSSPLAPEATLLLAQLLRTLERPQEALPLLKDLYLGLPGHAVAGEAERLLRAALEPMILTPEEQLRRAKALYYADRYRDAIALLIPLLASDPENAEVRLFLGRSQFAAKEYAQVITILLPLTDPEESAEHQAEALHLLGRAAFRSGDPLQAIAYLERITAGFPQSPLAAEALYLVGLNYEDRGEEEAALEVYARLLRLYPRDYAGENARWRRAWLLHRLEKLQAAIHELAHFATDHPHAARRWQAMYWRGRLLERLGDKRAAAEIYRRLVNAEAANPYSAYYIQAARQRLGLKPPQLAVGPGPADSRPVPPTAAKARELVFLRLTEEAAEEYWEIARVSPPNPSLLWEACGILVQANQFDRAVALARRTVRTVRSADPSEEVDGAFWTYLYPRAYWPWVDYHARETRLDPYLVMAVMREESAFSPTALSRAGARGLMQLMPTTAARVAAATRFPAPLDIDTPGANIALGTRYLAQLHDEFGGDVVLTLAAYNAGPHNVRRWVKDHGRVRDPETFVEEIPYPETQQYVKRVLGSYDRYRALYVRSQ
jgi:soluble lytic murein transglycosylase